MAENPNVAVLRDAYGKWNETKGGSVDHWMSIVAEEIDFRSLAQGAQGVEWACTYTSKAQLANYFQGLANQFEMIHFTVDDFIAEGDRVVAIGAMAWRNRQTGKILESPKLDVWRFRDGRAVSFHEYYDTAQAIASAQA